MAGISSNGAGPTKIGERADNSGRNWIGDVDYAQTAQAISYIGVRPGNCNAFGEVGNNAAHLMVVIAKFGAIVSQSRRADKDADQEGTDTRCTASQCRVNLSINILEELGEATFSPVYTKRSASCWI